ncbi:MAG: TetR/AcrR family transcriptional regulator [Gemmatimonadota bacterium]|jgi:AcrR family transcriptional regulator
MTLPLERGPRWRRRPQDRPEEILQAAMDIFAERGLSGARVEDIAEAAGVSKGTLYLYFSGKEELFKEAVRAKVRRTLDVLAEAAPPGEPVRRLRRFVDAYWAHLRAPSFGSLYRVVLSELHHFPELMRFYAEEVSGHVMGLTVEIITQGIEEGSFRPVDPAVASRMLVGVIVQHAVWTSRRELFPYLGERSDETLVSEIKEFLLSALLAPGAERAEQGESR